MNRAGTENETRNGSLRSGPNHQRPAYDTWAERGNPRRGGLGAGRRRSGRARVTVLLVVAALAAGAIGGYGLARQLRGSGTVASEGPGAGVADAADNEQWYTCGMHPNVLQKGPGDCPICQMRLTPLKRDSASGGGGGAGGGGPSPERKVLYWRAPMDPNYISQKPGKSPMGMDLVPVYADEDESPSAHTIRIDPVTIQNMGIRTSAVARGPLIKTIRTIGRVDYDEQLVTFVDTKFNGWIETLYIDETGMPVRKDERLFDVYSPELYAAQEEYLASVRNLPRLEGSTFAPAREEAAKLVEAAVTKLRYLDVSDEQIERLRETGEVEKTLAIHSPADGIVTEKMALEGMYVKPGMRLYTIADLSRVWVYVDVYEYQKPWIGVGQRATMTLPYTPGKEFVGKVVYIYPYLEQQTRVIKVRLEFENPTMELMPGMYANVRLEAELERDALLVPREAYIDSGTRQVVFVDRGGGKFAPRDIKVGVEAEDGMVEVLYGIDEGEVVVTSGQFMLDAESKLKEAVAKMMEAERAKTTIRSPVARAASFSLRGDEPGGGGAAGDGEESPRGLKPAAQASDSSSIPSDAAYACPMERHPDESDPARQGPYFASEPGKCPVCGMKLKPFDELGWVRLRRAAQGGDVAYTCPDHQHVFSEELGECPRCAKRLMPFKAMYTCPDPEHAGVISTFRGNCPHCGRGLAAFRGVWLEDRMAEANVPAAPGLADAAPYRCPLHPLVHSDRAGNCTICGAPLASGATADRLVEGHPVPPSAADRQFVCPMHAREVRRGQPGTCPICGMRLVNEEAFGFPKDAPAQVAAQMNYIMEHYLELQRLLASDRTTDVARHALGLASASEELGQHLDDPAVQLPPAVKTAAGRLHDAALKTTGASLDADRVTFVELSAAVRTLIQHARPDRLRWPKLYIYHCPMSKGDWVQTMEEKANPYYGFKMLKCGELQRID